jgi:CYTH domain-containing protein
VRWRCGAGALVLLCKNMNYTMDVEETKYTRVEYERRFVVSPFANWRTAVESYSKTFEDKYLRGSRLRLRILTDSDTGRRVIKLNKKFESPSPYFRTASRILLSQREYELLDGLEGDRLTKVRYYHTYLGRVFSIEVFEGELDGLVLCETESDGLEGLMLAEPPSYARREVTDDPFFEGGNLCRTTRADLMRKLSNFK